MCCAECYFFVSWLHFNVKLHAKINLMTTNLSICKHNFVSGLYDNKTVGKVSHDLKLYFGVF